MKDKLWRICFFAVASGVLALSALPAQAELAELTTEQCLELALNTSPLMKVAEADLEIARRREKEARAGKLPEVSYMLAAERGKDEPAVTSSNNFGNKLQIDWPLFTGGLTESLIDQAAVNVKAAEWALKNAKMQVGIDVLSACYRLAIAENGLTLAEESARRLREHFNHVHARYEQGLAAKLDLIRVEVEEAAAAQRLISAEKARRSASAVLNSLMGRELNSPVKIRNIFDAPPTVDPIDHYLEQAAVHNPEWAQAQLGLEIAEKELAAAKSGLNPSVSLSGAIDRYDTHWPGFENEVWSLGVTTQWRIFDSGKTRSRIEQARAEIVKARENLRQVKIRIELEINETYLGLQEAGQLSEIAKNMAVKAEEEYKIACVGYEAGFETSLNVLGYHETLMQTKTDYLKCLADHWLRRFALLKSAGIL